MPAYEELRSHLTQFHVELLGPRGRSAPQTRGGVDFSLPTEAAPHRSRSRIHATGIGLRGKGGKTSGDREDLAYKVFVFPDSAPVEPGYSWNGYPVEVVPLPWQKPQAALPNQTRMRPVVGGMSIAPLGATYSGTLGCLLGDHNGNRFVLSNNHVLAGVSLFPTDTQVCQPGFGSSTPTAPGDAFCSVATIIPLSFDPLTPNDADAATARVVDTTNVHSAQFGIPSYTPSAIATLTPGDRVTKSGAASGVTVGTVVAVVQNVQVVYGTDPLQIATFRESLQITGDDGNPFSADGDSGALVLELKSSGPGALLFSGDGTNTFATDISTVCKLLQAWPV